MLLVTNCIREGNRFGAGPNSRWEVARSDQAVSALCQKQTLGAAAERTLFDHLVGGDAQTLWHVEAKCPRGLEVDHEIKLGRQLYGQIGRLFAPQNAVHIEGG